MRISVNGEDRVLAERATIRDLLIAMGLDLVPVAVERNHDIVPRASHATTELAEGDAVEVVHFVGGG